MILLLALSTCEGRRSEITPDEVTVAGDVILITVDTLRADALGFAGNNEVETPWLDRLAAGGRVFTDAHAHSVTTLPSHASILTGLYSFQHGARHNGGYRLGDDLPTLATLLADAGFATAAFVGAFPLDSRFGLDRGFDVYDDDFSTPDSLFLTSERPGDEVVALAQRWWDDNASQRRFLWLHLFDPHAPYSPPPAFALRYPESPYLGEVAATDSHLSLLLEGLLEQEPAATNDQRPLVVFTSDHGESLGEHGEFSHGLFAYEATLRVPLVVWGAGVEPGLDSRAARHIDLLPTIAQAVGIDPPGELPGRSLLEPSATHPRVSYFEALSGNLDYGWAPLQGVLKDGMKLIDLPIPELYDLAVDPREVDNLIARRPDSARELKALLPTQSAWTPLGAEPSAEVAARLKSLGYVGGPSIERDRYGPDDDPKNLIEIDHKLALLGELAIAGDLEAAIGLAKEVLATRPTMGAASVYLANLQLEAGRPLEAIDTMRRSQQLGVASRDLLRQLALTLIGIGEATEGLDVLAPLLEDAGDLEARNHEALALAYLGREEQALASLRAIVTIAPTDVRAHENLSFVLLRMERFEEALAAARRTLDLDPGRAGSWNNLAIALYNLGRRSEAADAWKHSLDLEPEDPATLRNLATVEAQSGEG